METYTNHEIYWEATRFANEKDQKVILYPNPAAENGSWDYMTLEDFENDSDKNKGVRSIVIDPE